MQCRRLLCSALVAAGLLATAHRSEALETVVAPRTPGPVERPVKVEIEAGGVFTEGNTRTRSGVAKAGIQVERGPWRHVARGEALHTEDRARTTAQRLAALLKSDFRFTARDYLFATANYEDERFTGFDYRASGAAGYGRRLVAREWISLDLEVGPGVRESRREDGTRETEPLLRGAGRLLVNLGEHASFTQEAVVERDENGTQNEAVSAIRTRVIGNLALKATFTLRDRSRVPPGIRRTDSTTALTFVLGF